MLLFTIKDLSSGAHDISIVKLYMTTSPCRSLADESGLGLKNYSVWHMTWSVVVYSCVKPVWRSLCWFGWSCDGGQQESSLFPRVAQSTTRLPDLLIFNSILCYHAQHCEKLTRVGALFIVTDQIIVVVIIVVFKNKDSFFFPSPLFFSLPSSSCLFLFSHFILFIHL